MNNKNMCFIYTSDFDTRKILEKQGYQYITDCGNGTYVFLNDEKLNIKYNMNLSNVHYTNVLCI